MMWWTQETTDSAGNRYVAEFDARSTGPRSLHVYDKDGKLISSTVSVRVVVVEPSWRWESSPATVTGLLHE